MTLSSDISLSLPSFKKVLPDPAQTYPLTEKFVPSASSQRFEGLAAVPDTLELNPVSQKAAPSLIDRPRLLPPASFSEIHFLQEIEAFHDFENQLLASIGKHLKVHNTYVAKIQKEEIDKLHEAIKVAEQAENWSFVKKVLSSLGSALFILRGVLGLIEKDSSTLVGGLLIASGILLIANTLMAETGGWNDVADKIAKDNEKLKQRLATLLPAVFGLAAAAAGIFGSAVLGTSILDRATSIAQGGFAVLNGTTTIGKGYSDSKVILTNAELTRIGSELFIEKQMLEKTVKSLEAALDEINLSRKRTAQFVNMSVHLNQLSTQRI